VTLIGPERPTLGSRMGGRLASWIVGSWLALAACASSGRGSPAVLAGGQGVAQAGVPGSGAAAAEGPAGAQPMAAGGTPAMATVAGSGGAGAPASDGGTSLAGQPAAAGSAGAAASSLGQCSLPGEADPAAARALYPKWKADLLTSDGAGGFVRVRRPNSGTQINSSNSEGIGYGMLIAVYMDDQPTFDGLWQYEQLHRGKNGLMEWEIAPDGKVIGSGAASDGDEDMAFALIMADARWGGSGALAGTYRDAALAQLDLIWKFEVDHSRNDTLMPGDQFDGAQVINISYFAPAYYRAFAAFSGKPEWQRVVESSYSVLEATLNADNRNADNGLVPAWSTPEGVPMAPPGSGHPTHHQLDSCRTPFRIAQDYCWFGEARALRYLEKIGKFHAQVGVSKLLDGYNLDGSSYPGAMLHLAAFVAGAGVGAMAVPSLAGVRDEAYGEIMSWSTLNGGSEYYNKSWSMLGALMLTGQLTRHF
jgi:endo-1,4-beta-D-glucanase Y